MVDVKIGCTAYKSIGIEREREIEGERERESTLSSRMLPSRFFTRSQRTPKTLVRCVSKLEPGGAQLWQGTVATCLLTWMHCRLSWKARGATLYFKHKIHLSLGCPCCDGSQEMRIRQISKPLTNRECDGVTSSNHNVHTSKGTSSTTC